MRTACFVWVALSVACATAPRHAPEPMPAPAASPGIPAIAVSLGATERIAEARAKRLELWRERAKNATGNEHGTEALRQLA